VEARFHTDWSGQPPVAPLALVRPRSSEEVAAVLRLCHAHRIAVVPQGGLTGLAGGAVPVQGCVALSLERMNAMEAVDARTGLVTVQAGVTLQAVQEAAVAAGMGSAWTWAHAAAARSAQCLHQCRRQRRAAARHDARAGAGSGWCWPTARCCPCCAPC
jgi:FAD/FMN-containing dehydrogenase